MAQFKKGQSGNPAGRPKGSYSKPRFTDYCTEETAKELVYKAMEMAAQGDSIMLRFCVEHLLGKAPQALEMTGEGGLPFQIIITKTDGNKTS